MLEDKRQSRLITHVKIYHIQNIGVFDITNQKYMEFAYWMNKNMESKIF